jgi:hypothetical protein
MTFRARFDSFLLCLHAKQNVILSLSPKKFSINFAQDTRIFFVKLRFMGFLQNYNVHYTKVFPIFVALSPRWTQGPDKKT